MAATMMMMMSGIGKNNITSIFPTTSQIHHGSSSVQSSGRRQRFGLVNNHMRSQSFGTSSSGSVFHGERLRGIPSFHKRMNSFPSSPIKAQMKVGVLKKAPAWWEKGHHSNMKEVKDAQDLVDSLLNAGDRLVVVDFFSPGCGGCKALHPKICRLAETNPDVQFLLVNYEEHRSMCYSLSVHVLPFFRFYRGAEGRLCSFSCTNATIKKFKDALAKHSTDRCSLGPVKGLDEGDLIALAANKDLSFSYTPPAKPAPAIAEREEANRNNKIHTTANKHHHHHHQQQHREEEEKSSLVMI